MAKKKKYQIPKCPNCKRELKQLNEITYEIYRFNEKTGTYQEEIMSGDLEVRCYNCGEDVSEIFEEGACNYQADRR